MVTKGLDLPMLGTVGVIIGDTSLYFPDYTAEEKTFQMISQVIGRVGRGHGSSKIVIQTYSPESFSITTAVHKDYKAFYTSQLTERSDFSFPPFCFTLKLRVERKSSNSADKALKKIVHDTKSKFPGINISNPSPCFNEKTKNGYSWQAVVKASRRSTLLSIVSTLPSGIYYDLDPLTLL
jgi:primosomal protein N' (replication factor Y)